MSGMGMMGMMGESVLFKRRARPARPTQASRSQVQLLRPSKETHDSEILGSCSQDGGQLTHHARLSRPRDACVALTPCLGAARSLRGRNLRRDEPVHLPRLRGWDLLFLPGLVWTRVLTLRSGVSVGIRPMRDAIHRQPL